MSPEKFKESWIEKIHTLYNREIMKERYSSIGDYDLSCAIDKIKKEEYGLTPLCLIFFRPGVIGSNILFKSVPVVKIVSPPPIDLGIPFQYQTVYMQALDELVLAALGYVLLNQHFPSYLQQEDPSLGSQDNLNLKLADHNSEETKKAIAGYVYRTAPFDFVFYLVCSYMLNPYVFCIDKDGWLFPPIEGANSFIPKEGGPSLHYSSALYPVPFLYEYVSLVYLKIRGEAENRNEWKMTLITAESENRY